MDPDLVAVIEDYARTHGLNLPPHQIVSDALAHGPSGIEQLLVLLGLAANMGDTADNTAAQAGQEERDAKLTDAELKFPANEEESAAQLAGVAAQDPMSQMSGVTQAMSGLGQGITGPLNGLLQPFSQLGQQLPQAAQQMMQTGMGAMQQGAGSAATAGEEVPEALLGGLSAAELAGAAGGAGAAGAAGLAGTVPASELGPAPIPSASTVPAASPTTAPVGPPPGESAAAGRGGMAGMPMMPPGAMSGTGGTGDGKADTKRVVAPAVKNGAPVQGRITPPPGGPVVTKHVQGKPVATRRVIRPDQDADDGAGPGR